MRVHNGPRTVTNRVMMWVLGIFFSSCFRVIGENLKALEVAEEKAQQREEEYKKQVFVSNIYRYNVCGLLEHFLKGQCQEIAWIFHESNPPRPLISRLKWFFK